MPDLSGVRVVVFRVAGMACAAEAAHVREIVSILPATRIPGASDPVLGLINVRGYLVTLVDGRRALGHPAEQNGGAIVLLDVGGRTVGFLVDEVVDLFPVPADDLAPRADLPGLDPAIVRAVGRHGAVSFVLLDLDALLNPIFPS